MLGEPRRHVRFGATVSVTRGDVEEVDPVVGNQFERRDQSVFDKQFRFLGKISHEN